MFKICISLFASTEKLFETCVRIINISFSNKQPLNINGLAHTDLLLIHATSTTADSGYLSLQRLRDLEAFFPVALLSGSPLPPFASSCADGDEREIQHWKARRTAMNMVTKLNCLKWHLSRGHDFWASLALEFHPQNNPLHNCWIFINHTHSFQRVKN